MQQFASGYLQICTCLLVCMVVHLLWLPPSLCSAHAFLLFFLLTGCYSSYQGDSICYFRIPCHFVLWKSLQVNIHLIASKVAKGWWFAFVMCSHELILWIYMCTLTRFILNVSIYLLVNPSSTRWPNIVRRYLVTSFSNSLWRTIRWILNTDL